MGMDRNGINNRRKSSPTNGSRSATETPRVKVVVVGDGGSGKTSLLVVFTEREFPEEYVPTVFENYTADMNVEDEKVHLLLWDTAGQEDYDRLRPLSYDNADVIIMVYDVMNSSSYDNISIRWAPEIRHFCPGIPSVLVGCKTDLRSDEYYVESMMEQGKHPVPTEKGHQLAKEIGAAKFIECSAKAMENVDAVFTSVSRVGIGLDLPKKPSRSAVLFRKCKNCTIQ